MQPIKLMAFVCPGKSHVVETGGATQSSSAVMATGTVQMEEMKPTAPCAKEMSFPALEMVFATLVQIAATTRIIALMVRMKRTVSSVSQATFTVKITAVCLRAGFVILKMTVVMAVMKRIAQSLCPLE